MSKQIKLSLHVSQELNDVLDGMAEKNHCSKSEILRKSIVLMEVAVQEKEKGNHIGIFGKNHEIVKEIVGL